jgi:nucleoside-diphosphate-sugar epimerase
MNSTSYCKTYREKTYRQGTDPAKSGEQLRSSIDPARASRVFGWHPQVQLAAGLEETLRFVEAH